MKHVFGPVPSRRLGQSLGVDPIPFKTCNWNCVYCQLGRTVPVTNVRRDYFPPDIILAEVAGALKSHLPGKIDWVTFVGSGEPTLHASLGWMIRQVKALTSIPVAVITNGSLLYMPEVREALIAADAVLPTLDAGNDKLYRTMNRPHPFLTFDRLIESLVDFRSAYRGRIWLEVMLVRGLNDSEEALRGLAAHVNRIGPDEVHINLPTRPPAEVWVSPPEAEGIQRAMALLGDVAHVVHSAEGIFDLSGYSKIDEAIVGVIARHPMREDELLQALNTWPTGKVLRALTGLEAQGRARSVIRYGYRFWAAATGKFGETQSTPRTNRYGKNQ